MGDGGILLNKKIKKIFFLYNFKIFFILEIVQLSLKKFFSIFCTPGDIRFERNVSSLKHELARKYKKIHVSFYVLQHISYIFHTTYLENQISSGQL